MHCLHHPVFCFWHPIHLIVAITICLTTTMFCFSAIRQLQTRWTNYTLLLITLTLAVFIVYSTYSGCIVQDILPQPSSWSLSYHFPVGVTELKQCRRAFSLFPGNVTEKPIYKELNYNISLISVDTKAGILLHVRETRRGVPTGGGSSLLALSDAFKRQLCFYEDFFTGHYAIWCPPPARGQCVHVTVELKFASYSAYTIGFFPLVDRQLWQSTVCWNKTVRRRTTPGLPRAVTPPWKKTDSEAPHTCHIEWFRDAGNWSVMNDNGVKIPLLDNDDFCRRVRSFNRIVMIGPSHMRYKFNYIAFTCYNEFGSPVRKHGSAKVNGTTYILKRYMADIADLWTRYLEPMNLTGHDAVLIQHGSHDMCRRGTRFTLSTSLQKYFDDLEAIQRHSERRGFRLVALTSPPYGDRVRRSRKENRNNFSLAALARLVHTQLSAARVDVFDEFAVLLPHYHNDTPRCAGHYLCPDRKEGVVRGHTGVVALHLLVRHLAGELDTTTC